MSVWGALAGGFAGTLILTTALAAGSQCGFTRIDIPFLLGTAFTEDRAVAKRVGYGLHLLSGLVFALIYYAGFVVVGRASWQLGMAFGVVHALFAGTTLVTVLLPAIHPRMGTPDSAADTAPLLEPPGFMLLNYGRTTPILTVLAHLAYGAIVGAFVAAS